MVIANVVVVCPGCNVRYSVQVVLEVAKLAVGPRVAGAEG